MVSILPHVDFVCLTLDFFANFCQSHFFRTFQKNIFGSNWKFLSNFEWCCLVTLSFVLKSPPVSYGLSSLEGFKLSFMHAWRFWRYDPFISWVQRVKMPVWQTHLPFSNSICVPNSFLKGLCAIFGHFWNSFDLGVTTNVGGK